MENGEGPSHAPATSAPSSTPAPVYSREVTLQAHFTFGTQSMAPVQYAHVTPTSSSALTARPIMASGAPMEQFHWGPDGGAQCSITCGREGLTMTYNAQPTAPGPRHTPCAICDTIAASRPGPAITSGDTAPHAAITTSAPPGVATSAVTSLASPAISRSLIDLNRPHEAAATRSLTFSGSLDRATQRPVQQRPYGRRCKSTAHIILQNNELGPRESRPHEFHSTQREDPHHHHHHLLPGATHEGRGRARTRGGADYPFAATSGGWERVHSDDRETRGRYYDAPPALLPPCCPCQQCTALYSLASTLAHDRTCHACHHHHHHHHHQRLPCSPPPIHTPGPPDYPHPVGPEEHHAPPGKCPTTCTFNSHRSYEGEMRRDWCGHPGYVAPPAAPQPRSRTPSPRLGRRGSPKKSPRRSSAPSPESRMGRADDPPHQPQTTPVLPRRFPRMGAAAAAAAAAASASSGTAAGQAEGGSAPARDRDRDWERDRDRGARTRVRPRPRTIHIDVYCSSSSEGESSSPSSPVSDESEESGVRRPQAVVALGSKQHKKTELSLGRHHDYPLEKASSFVYSRGRHHSHAGRRSTFITDDVLTLSSSPPGQDRDDLSGDVTEVASAPPTLGSRSPRSGGGTRHSSVAIPAPAPTRPTTLDVPTSSPRDTPEASGIHRSRHSSLSYLSSPLDDNPWEGEPEPELASSAMSWRGSEFETSTPRLTSYMEEPSPRPTSDLSLSSLHEAFCDTDSDVLDVASSCGLLDSPKAWRSPQLERQRYIQKGQEERYREALHRRTQLEADRPSTATPPNVMELARLPAFSEFSKEELKVISKSLERRESLQASEQERSFRLQEKKETFKATEQKDSNRLLEWMQQYKEQEIQESKSQEQKEMTTGRTNGVMPSGCDATQKTSTANTEGRGKVMDRTDSSRAESRGSLRSQELKELMSYLEKKESSRAPERKNSFREPERKDSFREPERKDSFRGPERKNSFNGLERWDSARSLERKDSGKVLERKESFKARDKKEYYRSLERRDSGRSQEYKESSRGLERQESGRSLEKKDSARGLEWRDSGRSVEKKDSGRGLERRDSGRSVERKDSSRGLERRDSGRSVERKDYARGLERQDSGRNVERKDSGRGLERRDSGQSVERKDSARSAEEKDSLRLLGRKDSPRYVEEKDSKELRDSARNEGKRKDHERVERDTRHEGDSGRRSPERKRSFLEQLLEREESSRSDSVEWQDVVSTVRRRLSACAKEKAEAGSPQEETGPASPPRERAPTPQYSEEMMSPLPTRRGLHVRGDSKVEDSGSYQTTTVGGRFINIGLFRHLSRFPFSHTVPVPASRLMEARTACGPEQRKFVRPQMFGELRLSYPKRRGIHFGPPRNPQCSCENCRSWSSGEYVAGGVVSQLYGSRLRAWSLTDLGTDPGIALPTLPSSYPGTSLSRANSNASDTAVLPHVGSAATGREQQ